MKIDSSEYRSYCEVDLGAVSHNYREIKNIVGNNVKVMGVVKADAYGHGAVRVSETLIDEGIDYLAVATIEEAFEIRAQFKDIPILVLGYTPTEKINSAIVENITLTIYNIEVARSISECAGKVNKTALAHLKIDTGMNRIGFLNSQLDELLQIIKLPNISIEGVYTHFSDSEYDNVQRQFNQFANIYSELEESIDIKYKHCCNSAVLLNYPEMHLDMVRPGIMIYGLSPDNNIEDFRQKFKPVMSLKTKVIHLKQVPKGARISYGGTFETQRDSEIATLSIGYADGFSRRLSNNARIIINGQFAPIVGRVCMDQCMADVTGIDIKLLDTAIIFGNQGENNISVDEIAEKLDTINYEVVCSIGKRVPRVYLEI